MSDIFESKWGETKAALTEGLAGNKKKTMDVVLENTKRYFCNYYNSKRIFKQICRI